MYLALLIVAGVLFWAGATLLIDAWLSRRRPDLSGHEGRVEVAR